MGKRVKLVRHTAPGLGWVNRGESCEREASEGESTALNGMSVTAD
jgi:hypothetical protein